MVRIRQSAVAGTFYPGDADTLRAQILKLLQSVRADIAAPKCLIVPHAGYSYSGATAASAYASLQRHATTIHRVVLLGPAHRLALCGVALPEAEYFATPLGMVEVDHGAIASIAHLSQITTSAAAHQFEHSLEVQLPFLQSILADFKVVPLAVGDASSAEVAEILERLWGGPETLIVVSSDLSHFRPYENAKQIDGATAESILNLQ